MSSYPYRTLHANDDDYITIMSRSSNSWKRREHKITEHKKTVGRNDANTLLGATISTITIIINATVRRVSILLCTQATQSNRG